MTPRQAGHRAAHALIAASLARLRDQGADVADAWMFPHAPLHSALRRHGFIPRRTRRGGFQASALGPDAAARLPRIECAENWFLSLGDSDTV